MNISTSIQTTVDFLSKSMIEYPKDWTITRYELIHSSGYQIYLSNFNLIFPNGNKQSVFSNEQISTLKNSFEQMKLNKPSENQKLLINTFLPKYNSKLSFKEVFQLTVDSICNSMINDPEHWYLQVHRIHYSRNICFKYESFYFDDSEKVFSNEQVSQIKQAYDKLLAYRSHKLQKKIIKTFLPHYNNQLTHDESVQLALESICLSMINQPNSWFIDNHCYKHISGIELWKNSFAFWTYEEQRNQKSDTVFSTAQVNILQEAAKKLVELKQNQEIEKLNSAFNIQLNTNSNKQEEKQQITTKSFSFTFKHFLLFLTFIVVSYSFIYPFLT